MNRSSEFLFSHAIDLVQQFDGSNIVEIGSIRCAAWRKSDGHSTIAWGESGLATWSVDVNQRATLLTARLVGETYPNVRCVTCEGIQFLDNFQHSIDLLYLDGPHPDREDGRQWAADAFVAALPRFSRSAVLLIDDTDIPRRGKGEFVIPLAQSAGFALIDQGRQALLMRSDS